MRTLLVALALAGSAAAQDAGPYPLQVKAGDSVAVCTTGTIMCPASDPICDDTSVATAASTPDGLAFKGVKPGTTLCSAASAGGLGLRRVYRVTVTR
jgi:hypothetical protein